VSLESAATFRNRSPSTASARRARHATCDRPATDPRLGTRDPTRLGTRDPTRDPGPGTGEPVDHSA